MAERVGFEPTVPLEVQQISNLPRSTTPAPLLKSIYFTIWQCYALQYNRFDSRRPVAHPPGGSRRPNLFPINLSNLPRSTTPAPLLKS
jgi:hypothetical protein